MIGALVFALALLSPGLAAAQERHDDDDEPRDGEPETIEGVRPPSRDTIEGEASPAARNADRDARDRDRDRRRPPKRRAPRRAPKPAPAPAGPVEIPIDVGVGPVLLVPNPGPIFDDGPLHFGLAVSLAAVVDQELIRRYQSRIPPEYRGMARNLDEVRVRPWFLGLIPELLVISPPVPALSPNTGMYGAVWRPVGVSVSPISEPVRVSVGANLDVAYVLIHSATLGGGTSEAHSFTHFLRPGVNLDATIEVPLSESLLVSTGWSSDLFIPQPIGRTPFEIEPVDQALWHLGGPFLKVHVRIPYQLDL